MSTSSSAEKENQRKEKRVSVNSPSTLLSPASKVLHKKARISVPFSTKTNDLATGDAKFDAQSSPISSSSTSANTAKVVLADELKDLEEGGNVTPPMLIVEDPKTPMNTPLPSVGTSFDDVTVSNESAKGSFVPLVEDPFLDASASETVMCDNTFNESAALPLTPSNDERAERTRTKDESFRSDSTFVGEVLASDVPNTAQIQSPDTVLNLNETEVSTANDNEELQCALKEGCPELDGKTVEQHVSHATTPNRSLSSPQAEQAHEETAKSSYVASLADPLLDATAIETTVVDDIIADISATASSASVKGDLRDEHATTAVSEANDSRVTIVENYPTVDLCGLSSLPSADAICRDQKQASFDGDNVEQNEVEKGISIALDNTAVEDAVKLITTALSSDFQLAEASDSDATQMDSCAVGGTNVGECESVVEQTEEQANTTETKSHTAEEQSVQYEDNNEERKEETVAKGTVPVEEANEGTPIKAVMEDYSKKQVEESSGVDVVMDESGAVLSGMDDTFRPNDSEADVCGGSAVRVTEADTLEDSYDAVSDESISAAVHCAESTPQVARILSEKKRSVRESLMEPPSTPDAVLTYARQRIDDYSFRINEAYCDSSQLCVNCYAMRIELENITKKYSTLSEEHRNCHIVRDVGESSLEYVDQLKSESASINEQLIRLTSENATLKQQVADIEREQRAATALQDRRNEQNAELEQLRNDNAKLVTENANLVKDIDDYKFVMEREVAKWKNTANDLKKQLFDLEGQSEARKNVVEAFETARMQLKAEFDAELAATKQHFERKAIDARSLVDRNMASEIDKLKEEILALTDQLAEERSKVEVAETKVAVLSSEKEEFLSKASAMAESNLHGEEYELLKGEVKTLKCKLEQQVSLEKNNLASLQKERDELQAKITRLEEDLQGELETKEILQDALKGSEESKEDLAEQLVKMEETSAQQLNQLHRKITELEKELSARSCEQRMDVQVATDGNAALLAKLEHCKAEMRKKESSVERLQSQLDQLTEEKKFLSESNERKESLLEELRRERDQLVDQVAQQGNAASEYLEMEITQKASLQKEIDSLREQLSNIMQQTAASVGDAVRAEFEKESKEKGNEIARLELVKRELEQQVQEMEAKVRQAELEKDRKEHKLEQLENEVAALRKTAEECKADFERSLQANNSEWEDRVAHWRQLSESRERLLQELAESMKHQAAQLVKASVDERVEWLQKRVAQNDAELKSLNEELTRAHQQIEREYSVSKEKDEHLVALKVEVGDLKSAMENIRVEKEAAELRLKQVTLELTQLVDAQEVKEKRIKAECMAAERISELDKQSRTLEAALAEARKDEQRTAKELRAQTEEVHALKEQLKATSERIETEKSEALGKVEMLQAELERSKHEVEALRARSLQTASLEKELNELRAEREADLARMKAQLMESSAKCDFANVALTEATGRIHDLELKLAEVQKSAPAVAHVVSLSKQDGEEVEELRRRVAMLESENERMGAACDEADDEIRALVEEKLELKRILALKEGLSKEQVARRLGNIQPFFPTVTEETVVSVDDISVGGASPEAANDSGSSKLRTKSPKKKSKSSKKDEPAAEQQSCRTQ